MRIGLVSDTHNRVLASLLEALRGMDEILHAGDVCREDVMAELEAVAPVVAVHGNCDERGLVQRLPAERRIEREGLSIALVHGHQTATATVERIARLYGVGVRRGRSRAATRGAARADEPAGPRPGLVVFGHSHVASDTLLDGVRFFNPGTAGGVRYAPTIGVLTIAGGRFELEHVALSR